LAGPRDPTPWIDLVAVALGDGAAAPFVPTGEEAIRRVLDALELGPDDVFYDLGCGDGRVAVEAAASYGVRRSVCVEIRPELAAEAVERARAAGVEDRVLVLNTSFFDVGLWDATAVYMYLLTSINEALRPKLERELRPGARVATLDFEVPGWTPARVIGGSGWQNTIYLYIVRGRRAP